MKIIRHGETKKIKHTFECVVCGCVFEADAKECDTLFLRNEVFFRIDCPCCGASVSCSEALARGKRK